MHIEMIAVGDELLDGRVADLNAYHLGQMLRELGYTLHQVTFVPDNVDAIVHAIDRAARHASLIVLSGGLGCTDDDRTRDALAAWSHSSVIEDPNALTTLQTRLARAGRTLRPALRKHASRVAASQPVPNPVGLAIGMHFPATDTLPALFALPGVPAECQAMCAQTVLPNLLQLAGHGDWTQRRLQVAVLGESRIEAQLAPLDLPPSITLSICARDGWVTLGLGAHGEHTHALDLATQQVRDALGTYVIGEDDTPLPARIGALLTQRDETLTIAESCTGGLIGHLITETPGSSAYFLQGFVTYHNNAKMQTLGVREETLIAHGAVSQATVCEMASGARSRASTTWAVATSGIAGPGGGTPEKPVGLVHMAVAHPHGVTHRALHFGGRSRSRIKLMAAHSALALLLALLEDREPFPGKSLE